MGKSSKPMLSTRFPLTLGIIVYTMKYRLHCEREKNMEKAKLFINGRSQAVRLPKAYRFKGKEVYIKKVAEGVLLIPKDRSLWDTWEQNLLMHSEPFMTDRNQPENAQKREGLDEIFA